MLKRTLILVTLVSAVGTGFPTAALASRTIAGRITAYSATSLSVIDKEVLTVAIDNRTVYTKLITQKPWQEDTRLNATALGAGRFVAVHVRKDNPNVADWVQIATDMRPVALATSPTSAMSAPSPAPSTAPELKSKSSDLLTSEQLKELIATAKTPADHVKLQKHFLALAAKYEVDANEHAAEAQAYRKNPSFMESKNPVGPGTAAHCERFADLDRQAAKEARDLASAHEHMAAAK
jgi:hypothetical protein